MIGYWAIGRNGRASAPPRQMNSAITAAKIGRSMKKLDINPSRQRTLRSRAKFRGIGRGLRGLPGNGIHNVARFEFLKTFDHDPIAGVEPVEDEPLLVHDTTGAHRFDHCAVVGANHIDLAAAGVVALNRLLRDCERVAVGALLDLDAHIHARQQLALRDWETLLAGSPGRCRDRRWHPRIATCRRADRASRRRARAAPSPRRARLARARRSPDRA